MTDVARITVPPESFKSATPATDYQRSSHDEVKLEANDNREPESSPNRSGTNDTQASSADEGKSHDAKHGPGPSVTASGASSVNGNYNTHGSLAQPLSAKKGPQSFFSGSKIKHLKKQDGIPLWRADIQYDFLKAVFNDTKPVFTNSYSGVKNLCFADIYVDAMARSSKTSKILRDKLLTERNNALNMAMVCLLVNVGRMNTTLNFFPEMKAQLRTYHAIPSLQAHTDSSAYKQLQDAPRLKSILKGACEDRKEPQTLDQIMVSNEKPKTNPINLVFILSTYAPKITEMHFPENMDFYDLIMRSTLSSKSRAKAFLWLMWLYLESGLKDNDCTSNPFGKGKPTKGSGPIPWAVPEFEYLTEEQAAKENVDTDVEKEFGEQKRLERKRLLGEIQNAPAGIGRGRGRKTAIAASPDMQSPGGSPPPSGRRRVNIHPRHGYPEALGYESESQTRSGTPESAFQTPANGSKNYRRISSNIVKMNMVHHEFASSPMDMPQPMKHKGGRPKASAKRTADGELKPAQRIILKSGGKQLGTPEAMGYSMSVNRTLLPSDRGSPMVERAPKPRMTSHQMAVQRNRQDRVDHIIDRKLRRLDMKRKKQRIRIGAIARAWARIKDFEEPLYMSDDEQRLLRRATAPSSHLDGNTIADQNQGEEHAHPAKKARIDRGARDRPSAIGPAGLIPRRSEEKGDENDDFGEEALSLAAALRRSRRRMERWEAEDRRREAVGFAFVEESRGPAPEQMATNASAGVQNERSAPDPSGGDDRDEEMPEAAAGEESDADVDME